MSITDKRVLSQPISVLSLWGLNPFATGKVPIRVIIMFILTFSMFLLVAFRLISDWKNANADIWVTCISTLEGLVKATAIAKKRQTFSEIAQQFNNLRNGLKLQEFPDKTHNIEITLKRGSRIYKALLLTALCAFTIKPILAEQRVLPSEWYDVCNIESSTLCYVISYAIHLLIGSYCISIIFSFDCMFWGLLACGCMELELIELTLQQLNIRDDKITDDINILEEISNLVEYHNRIFTYIRRINDTHSGVLVLQFVVTLITVCTAQFCLINNGFPPPLRIVLNYTPYYMMGSSQIFLYCLSGQLVIEQWEGIADAAYNSDWWRKNQPKLVKRLCLIIIRSQKKCKIIVGGLWELKMETFVRILKAAASMLTFMKTMYN